MAKGNGAYIVHKLLETKISGYQVEAYNPYLTLFPPLLWKYRNRVADILHVAPDYAPFFYVKGKPMVLTFHGFSLDRELDAYNTLMQKIHYRTDLKWFTMSALAKASRVVCVSQYLANLVKHETGYKKDIQVIYNGVDENSFLPRSRSSGKYIEVLFSGNLISKKGAELLPGIIRRVDDRVRIHYTSGLRAGDQHFEHPRLIPLGRVPYSEMHNVYPAFDMLLFPTVREGFGMAAIEAMSCGLPVVASNTAALPELVEEGRSGYLCEVGDAEAFASAINHLAENETERRIMGEFNRARVEKFFTLERMAREYARLFDEVLLAR